jgi:hypothetical protein
MFRLIIRKKDKIPPNISAHKIFVGFFKLNFWKDSGCCPDTIFQRGKLKGECLIQLEKCRKGRTTKRPRTEKSLRRCQHPVILRFSQPFRIIAKI